MSIKPSVLILEQSSFPDHIALEECERLGKTTDQQDAIIRLQRPRAASKFEKFVRFFSDLLNGVTRAKGELIKQPNKIPEIIHIRGVRCEVKNSNGRVSETRIRLPQQAGEKASKAEQFTELKVIVRENPALQQSRQKALHLSMATQLEALFEAYDPEAGLEAVHTFLELAGSKNQLLSTRIIAQLLVFSDALAHNSLKIFSALTDDVQVHVRTKLQHFQDQIRQIKPSDSAGPSYADFRFKLLANLAQQAPIHEKPQARADSTLPPESTKEASATPHSVAMSPSPITASLPVTTAPDSLPAQAIGSAPGSLAATIAPPTPPAPQLPTSLHHRHEKNLSSDVDQITDDMLTKARKNLKSPTLINLKLSPAPSSADSLQEVLSKHRLLDALKNANQGKHDNQQNDQAEWE